MNASHTPQTQTQSLPRPSRPPMTPSQPAQSAHYSGNPWSGSGMPIQAPQVSDFRRFTPGAPAAPMNAWGVAVGGVPKSTGRSKQRGGGGGQSSQRPVTRMVAPLIIDLVLLPRDVCVP